MIRVLENVLLVLCLFVLTHDAFGAKYQSPHPHSPAEPVVYPYDYCQQIQPNEEFDYVVIGAGPAGATVARRLAENPKDRVLLLEAGDDPPPERSDFYYAKPKLDTKELWLIPTKPSNRFCAGHRNNQCTYTLGKYLGGCSIINGELYIRGNHQDYEDWKNRGNPGWGWKDLFPYFLKLENYRNSQNLTSPDPGFHSTHGPFTTSPFPINPHSEDLRKHIEKAVIEMGLPINNDINGKSQIGFGPVTGLIEETGYRNNAAKSYLLNIPGNLKVCKKSLVKKLLIAEEKIVKNAQFVYTSSAGNNKTIFVKAKKEYIVTAGPLNTPQLLERSGIGQKSVLDSARVKLVHELKGVGQNLQEQSLNNCGLFEVDLHNSEAQNPLSAPMISFHGFLNMANYSHPVPNAQFYFTTAFPFFTPAYKPEIRQQFQGIKGDIILFSSNLLRQTNRGHVHIKSDDPISAPDFNPSQYTSEEETKTIGQACRLLRRIISHSALAKYNPRPITLNECKKYPYNSDEEILCAGLTIPLPLYHFAGTAAMGPATDEMSVVDTHLKVHGIKNLRIADLSVMPDIPRGNTEIPTIAVAEKAADIIKQDNKKPNKVAELSTINSDSRQKKLQPEYPLHRLAFGFLIFMLLLIDLILLSRYLFLFIYSYAQNW